MTTSTASRMLMLVVVGLAFGTFPGTALASDHLDSPATVANPQADIADVYAWTSSDGRRLNLVMTVLGHSFSDKLDYTLHIDSGRRFGTTTASTSLICHFGSSNAVRCTLGKVDSAIGDPTAVAGLQSQKHHFRVYAALRDDPFYNNIKGLLSAYQTAAAGAKDGAVPDGAGCAKLSTSTAHRVLNEMTHTDGGPAHNFLYNWTVSAIVVSVDLHAVSAGGKLLAIWGTTSLGDKQLDRMARPFVANTLLGSAPFSSDDASGLRRQQFNEATATSENEFIPDLEKSLAFQDSLDGQCGNQLLAASAEDPSRYRALAQVLVDDRLWVNSASTACTQFFAVELAQVAGEKRLRNDCGGRTPLYDTSNVWRSLVIAGSSSGITDGLPADEHPPSATVFPFLAAPDPDSVDH